MSHEKSDMYQYGLLSAIALHGLGYLPAGIYWMLERWGWRGKELHAALIAKMDPHRANQNKYSGEQQ
jgi:hypothetical protein